MRPLSPYPIRTPELARWLMPERLIRLSAAEPTLYLTFDDGPAPGITDWLLDCLADHQALATFFCVGANVKHYPELVRRAHAAGHALGNHTYTHLNGWYARRSRYLNEVALTDRVMERSLGEVPQLFRPPYGKLRYRLLKDLQRTHKVVLWDLLPGDFDASVSAETLLERSLRLSRPGSIIVLHDSYKSAPRVKAMLPSVLRTWTDAGYRLASLPTFASRSAVSLP